MKSIHVVAAIIWDESKEQLLISKRPDHLHKGGCWEFPGGKVEGRETETDALQRELLEELNIQFDSCQFFKKVKFSYPEKNVELDFYHVYGAGNSDVQANEGQIWRWIPVQKLIEYHFPEANQPVVEALLKVRN